MLFALFVLGCSSSSTNPTDETPCAIVGPAPDTECAYAALMDQGERWSCERAPFEPTFRYCEEIAATEWCCL